MGAQNCLNLAAELVEATHKLCCILRHPSTGSGDPSIDSGDARLRRESKIMMFFNTILKFIDKERILLLISCNQFSQEPFSMRVSSDRFLQIEVSDEWGHSKLH